MGKQKIRLSGRSLLTLSDLSEAELLYLLDLAARLKRKRRHGHRGKLLRGRHVALVFEKASTRTRAAATVAAVDEGGSAEYLESHDLHLGKKESVKDTARVLGRMFDGILFRGYRHEHAEILAREAGVPVWNGLTDRAHPTQALADLMTIREHFGRLAGLKVVYAGDGRNNVCLSLMRGCAMAGMDFTDCTPPELAPPPALVAEAAAVAARHGCTVAVEPDPARAALGANVIYTDVWVSMGEESQFQERLRLLRPYQVNESLMRATGNLESGQVIFLHCLPAFHNRETEVTRELGALEVTDDVFEAPYSRVFDQAENRMHTIKALMAATLAPGPGGRRAR
jgi:ornithine carbamoyltransferase